MSMWVEQLLGDDWDPDVPRDWTLVEIFDNIDRAERWIRQTCKEEYLPLTDFRIWNTETDEKTDFK